MKRLAVATVLLAVGFIVVSQNQVVHSKRRTASYASDHILVKLRPAPAQGDQQEIANQLIPSRNRGVETLQLDDSGGIFLLQLDGSTSVEEAIQLALQNPNVEYAEPDYAIYPYETLPNDPFFTQQWGLNNDGSGGKAGADIGAVRVWDSTTGSDDVVVAVIDTGVDLAHVDLSSNIWINPGEIPQNGVDDDGNGFVDDLNGWNFADKNNDPSAGSDFHATHVSGIIGASGNNGVGVAGVAWRIKLMAIKFISGREGSTSGAIKSMNYAVRERQRGVNVRVINASWGGRDSDATSLSLRDAIAAAGRAGILFVCASGNGGDDRQGDDIDEVPDYPSVWSSEIQTMVSVAALDTYDNLPSFSDYGSRNVTVGAPGTRIVSTVPGGYGYLDGTSMATPHVSGVAALLWAREPALTPELVRDRIVRTAVPVLSLASRCVSSGRANAFNATSNLIAPVTSPAIARIVTTKKLVTVDGLGFLNGSSVIEVNGVSLGSARYDSAFVIANGTLTRLSMKLGKAGINSAFPPGQPVTVKVFNPTTGERSAPFVYVRS